jgi:hypothetical protein
MGDLGLWAVENMRFSKRNAWVLISSSQSKESLTQIAIA